MEAGHRYGLPVMGTAAHMWTMAHESEEASFEGYVAVFPNASLLLIDTYDTVRGASRAAEIARDKLKGVRIDSGDLEALSREVRQVLDASGCQGAKIVVSGDITQIDLPPNLKCGLVDALERLRGLKGVATVMLTGADIVRHPLVQQIVNAYEHRPKKRR